MGAMERYKSSTAMHAYGLRTRESNREGQRSFFHRGHGTLREFEGWAMHAYRILLADLRAFVQHENRIRNVREGTSMGAMERYASSMGGKHAYFLRTQESNRKGQRSFFHGGDGTLQDLVAVRTYSSVVVGD